jgi:uncharacterized protein (TIRG00374 family)
MKRNIIRISALLGILIFVFIVYQIGILKIWENIKKITWQNFLILMVLRLFYWILRTINWKVIFDQYEAGSSLLHLFNARMCSQAVGQLTPTAQLGGEAIRIYIVKCSSKRISLASVVVDKTIEFLTTIAFTIIGVAIAIVRIPMPGKIKTFLIGFNIVALLLVLFFLSKQKKGLFKWFIELMAKMKIKFKFLEKNWEKIKETDEHISDFYRNHRKAFLGVSLLYSLLIMLWTTEVHLTLVFIGATNISFVDSFLITVLGSVAFVVPLIPGFLGIYEATYVALFAMLGKGTALGFTLVVIRRIIALLWAGIGLIPMLKRKSGHW